MTAQSGHTLTMQPLQTKIVGDADRTIWLLQAAVALVLLIVCANLANLVMARAESRRGEFAMRAALGASTGRLLRQAMTEGVLLSGAGGALGLWVAAVGVRALVAVYPESVPRTSEIAIDVPVLLFAFGVSVATGVLFALAPAAQRRVSSLVTALKAGGAGAGGASRHHVRRALVTAEVALAVILLMGAGLLLRTLYNLNHVDAGFERSRRMTFSLSLPEVNYGPAARARAFERLLAALRATPGVESATGTSDLPPITGAVHWTTTIGNTGAERFVDVHYYQFAMSEYFETLGVPIVQGRGFAAVDAASPALVAVVNETLANRFWPNQSAVGQRLRLGGEGNPWFSVIGVARDVKQGGLDREAGPQVYLFVEQQLAPGLPDGLDMTPETLHVVMRTALPPGALSRTLDQLVRDVDRTVPIVRLREMDAVVAESIDRPRLLAQLLGMFAGLALLLAAVGTYGVLSYTVARRRREIGIRIALGAPRGRVVALVMSQGLILTVIGLAAGLAAALALRRTMAALLFGVDPADPTTLVAVATTIAATAAFACWLPAWRASRLDPNVVLRAD
jgi:predicted permease